jgi:amino acid permease
MEIKSNMKTTYLRNYNEAKGVAVNKKRVLKYKTNKVPTYLTSALITVALLFICSIIFAIIDSSNVFKILFPVLLILYITYVLTRTIESLYLKKDQIDFINTIKIDEEGITDSSFI